MKTLSALLLIALGGVMLFGCNSDMTGSNPTTHMGTPVTIGSGTANTWITTDGSGNLNAIGVTVSDAALAGLGTKDSMFELPMPAGVSTVFKSVVLAYATHDAAPYNKPHIDPHFFYIGMNDRMNIMDGMDGMMPMNMTMPSGFMTDSMSEMMMGTHWIDTTASEFHGTPFQCTFDYGFSKGNLVFLEVMCDKASLEGHKALTGPVRKPGMMGGMLMHLPGSYKVSYDATAHTSSLELDGF